MPRVARVTCPGLPHHVTHRGNRRQDVFHQPKERRVYLRWLADYGRRHELDVWAYCLMDNHVHLLVVPLQPTSLSKAIGRAHWRFSQWQNRCHEWSGHLWENRFYSTPLDEKHLWTAVRYIELNPVRAGLVDRADRYPWSSARSHALGHHDPLLAATRPFPGPIGASWAEWLGKPLPTAGFELLRKNTTAGRPTGSRAFVREMEQRLNRSLTPRTVGQRSSR